MSNQQSTLELTFEFSFLGFTPKEVEISEKIGITFHYRIINLDKSLAFSAEKSHFISQRDGGYYFDY